MKALSFELQPLIVYSRLIQDCSSRTIAHGFPARFFENVTNADNSIFAFCCVCNFTTHIALKKFKPFATPLGENVGFFKTRKRTRSRPGLGAVILAFHQYAGGWIGGLTVV